MFILRRKKPISILVIVALVLSLAAFVPNYATDERNDSLRNFVQDVRVFDISSYSPELVDASQDTLYIGNVYKFIIDFAETEQSRMALNQDGVLLYQLPSGIHIEEAVSQAPIYEKNQALTNGEQESIFDVPDLYDNKIGSYNIDTDGLVTVWLNALMPDTGIVTPEDGIIEGDVTTEPEDGITEPDGELEASGSGDVLLAPDSDIMIDDDIVPLGDYYYENISFSIEIIATVAGEGYGVLDFGNNIKINIAPAALLQIFEEVTPFDVSDSWDLSNFIQLVEMFDTSITPPKQIFDGDSTYIGRNYLFEITFAETSQHQLAYTQGHQDFPDGRLILKLPDALHIQTPIDKTPLYGSAPNNAVIGWYTIDRYGIVQVWFDDVQMDGIPTPPGINFIDYYVNVEIRLDIVAQLTAGGDGSIDFGDGITITVEPPGLPPASLSIHKSSRYLPDTQQIMYQITITAAGDTVTNISLTDVLSTPNLELKIPEPTYLPNAGDVVHGFRYRVQRVDDPFDLIFTTFKPTWTESPAQFSYEFVGIDEEPLKLEPNDFIIVAFTLDLVPLIENNPDLAINILQYDFTVINDVTVSGTDIDGKELKDEDSTVDHVRKSFPIEKNGMKVTGNAIEWVITIGDSYPTPLNGGVVTDELDERLYLPLASEINIKFYDHAGAVVHEDITNMQQLEHKMSSTIGATGNNVFEFTVPTNAPDIHKIVISYVTEIPAGLVPHEGQPSIVFSNNVNITLPDYGDIGFGSGGNILITADTVKVVKTTSGICGTPENGYFVDYHITVYIPAGLRMQPLYLYDTLGLMPGGTGVPNEIRAIGDTPIITATTSERESIIQFNYSIVHTEGSNSWRIYLGSNYAQNPGEAFWPFRDEVTLNLNYRVYLNTPLTANPDDTAAYRLSNNRNLQLSNAIYLINSMQAPNLGAVGNVVGSVNVNDRWPLFKVGTSTDNPALFNYTVTIMGNYSDRTDPLFREGSNPSFTDTFDIKLGYVPRSFYIRDMTSGQIFAPPEDLVIESGSNTFTVYLRDLHLFNTTPAQGGVSQGERPNWFVQNRNFEVRYQMLLLDPNAEWELDANGNPITKFFENTARISVNADNPNSCVFESDSEVKYTPQRLSKSMAPTKPGSDRINVEIIINADGGFLFDDSQVTTQPEIVTARDELTNLLFFINTVRIYTQDMDDNGIWTGIWRQQAYTVNDRMPWSVNVESLDAVEFVIPNATPVKITYDALVTLPVGEQGTISNKISIFDEEDEDNNNEYEVGSAGVGVGAGSIDLNLMKTDPFGNPLRGATFSLYVTDLSAGNSPPGRMPVAKTVWGPNDEEFNFGAIARNVSTGFNGVIQFSDQWLVSSSSFNLLYVLVEDEPPIGFEALRAKDTYFTLNPTINTDTLLDRIGYEVNQVADFITIMNSPAYLLNPGYLRIQKIFTGLTVDQINEHLTDLKIVITDPRGEEHEFGFEEIMRPRGIVMEAMQGMYFLQELNTDVAGFTWSTYPPMGEMGIKFYVMPNMSHEVLIVIENIYTRIPHVRPESPGDPGDPYDPPERPPVTPPETPPANPPYNPEDPNDPRDPSDSGDSQDNQDGMSSGEGNDTVPRTDGIGPIGIYFFFLMVSIIAMGVVGIQEVQKRYKRRVLEQ